MAHRTKLVVAAVTTAVVVSVAVISVVTIRGDDGAESPTVELGGMAMSRAELRDLGIERMGGPLEDVELASARTVREDDGTLRGGTRSFEIEARPVRWEYRDGQTVAAWAYDGAVPGPVLRAIEGERIRVTVSNALPEPTTVHWHGVDVPWTEDGVPGVTQDPIEPGARRTYEFSATPAGTRWYHTHGSSAGDEASQLDMGLAGALVIEPRRRTAPADVDQVLVLDEWQVGAGGYNAAMMDGPGHAAHDAPYNVFTINGRAAPDVPDIVVDRGQRVRLRMVNASTMNYHPMHLHGHQFRVVALDGNPVPVPQLRNVVLLAPGETADVEFVADNPGVWMLHCHDLHHAGGGMHQLVRYRGYEPIGTEQGDHGGGH
jgi:FtsP/CotA-like multicopper oxidase with cupredoxin domain